MIAGDSRNVCVGGIECQARADARGVHRVVRQPQAELLRSAFDVRLAQLALLTDLVMEAFGGPNRQAGPPPRGRSEHVVGVGVGVDHGEEFAAHVSRERIANSLAGRDARAGVDEHIAAIHLNGGAVAHRVVQGAIHAPDSLDSPRHVWLQFESPN